MIEMVPLGITVLLFGLSLLSVDKSSSLMWQEEKFKLMEIRKQAISCLAFILKANL